MAGSSRLAGLLPLSLVTLAALLWAFVPVFLVLSPSITVAGALVATVVVNFSKAVPGLVVTFAVVPARTPGRFRKLVSTLRSAALLRLIVIDGAAMAASNFVFIVALAIGDGAVITLILNSWPIVASAFLLRSSTRYRRVKPSQLAGASLAVLGVFALVVAGRATAPEGHGSLTAVLLAVVGAVGQGIVVIIHQRFLQRIPEPDRRHQPLWQASRGVLASALTVPVAAAAIIIGDPGSLPSIEGVAFLALAGSFWGASAILFHYGVFQSETAFSTLPWLLAPLASAVLVAVVEGSTFPEAVVLGGVIVLAANSLLSLRIEPPRNVAVLIVSIVLMAFLELSIRGRNLPEYYAIGQTLGAFFAISFGFVVTRLNEQRNQARLLELRWRSRVEMSPEIGSVVSTTTPRDVALNGLTAQEAAALRADRAGAEFLSRSLLPVSEVLIVVLLGLGTCGILVYGRPDNTVASFTSFLIVSTVLFSVITLGLKLVEELTSFAPGSEFEHTERGRLGEALFGYISALVAYITVVVALFVGPANWPEF